jgi:hypothetical protein
MATLIALGEYHAQNLHYTAGQTFEANDDLALFLMADAPANFEVVTVKEIEAPPVDKMLRAPKGKK